MTSFLLGRELRQTLATDQPDAAVYKSAYGQQRAIPHDKPADVRTGTVQPGLRADHVVRSRVFRSRRILRVNRASSRARCSSCICWAAANSSGSSQ